jgi:hypothetical protein
MRVLELKNDQISARPTTTGSAPCSPVLRRSMRSRASLDSTAFPPPGAAPWSAWSTGRSRFFSFSFLCGRR